MALLITFLIIIFVLIILGIIGWITYEYTRDEDYEEDFNHGINLCDLHLGRAYGSELELTPVISGRSKVRLKPKDVHYKTLKKMKDVSPIEFITPKVVSFPRGTWSKEKNINLYLPKHASDLPKDFKETPFGKFMMAYIELDNASETEIEAMKEGLQRQKEQIVDLGMGEASRENISRLRELFADAMDGLKDKKQSGSPLSNPGSNVNRI